MSIVLRVLGPFETEVGGLPVEPREWRQAKAKLAFAYLAMRPHGASKDDLADLLFPFYDTGRTAVNVVISRIRHALGTAAGPAAGTRLVQFHGGGLYRLDPAFPVHLDVEAFRSHLAAGRRPDLDPAERRRCLEAAVALYRGPFMREFPDSTWCQIERERLRRELGAAYEALIDLASRRDDWRTVEDVASRWLGHDPVSQLAHRARILSHAMRERRDEALRAGRLAVDCLARELLGGLDQDLVELLGLIRDDRLTVRHARELLDLAS